VVLVVVAFFALRALGLGSAGAPRPQSADSGTSASAAATQGATSDIGAPAESGATTGSTTPDVVNGGSADGIKISTFLGGALRRSYGIGPAPSRLGLVWKTKLGSGQTQRKIDNKLVSWSGSGWTGQCTVVRDKGRDYLLINGYDHNLHKIDALTGKVIWQAKWDDVIKSTNTVIANPNPTSDADRLIVVAGSRRGSAYKVGDPRIMPLRAVSFTTGRELWRLPIPKTINYSQDVDSSPLMYNGVLYAAVEPGYVYALDPFTSVKVGNHREPKVLGRSQQLFTAADAKSHPDLGEANVAVEASPSRVGDVLYIACGAGRVYGLKLPSLAIVWNFRTGTDLDGSTVLGSDGVLLQAVEKQYTSRRGGVLALDPSKSPAQAPLWYFPTLNRGISEWKGGVIGSVAVNDQSNLDGRYPRLAAFVSVDGYVRVIARDAYISKRVLAPGVAAALRTPSEVFRGPVGAGISTPIIVGDAMVAAGYDKTVHLYRIAYRAASKGAHGALVSPSGQYWTVTVKETSKYQAGGSFESTPIIWGGRVYIGCRDGYLYCLGSR
jgi:outer membrane protein assembly factor BamB